MGERRGSGPGGRYPGESDEEFAERVTREAARGSPFRERPRARHKLPGESDREFAARIAKMEQARLRQERRRHRRYDGEDAVLSERPDSELSDRSRSRDQRDVPRDAARDDQPSSRPPSRRVSRAPSRTQTVTGGRVIQLVPTSNTGRKVPTLYGIPLDAVGQPDAATDLRDTVTDRDTVTLEGGVGGEGSGRPEIVEQSPSGLPEPDVTRDRDRDSRRDMERDVTRDRDQRPSGIRHPTHAGDAEFRSDVHEMSHASNGLHHRDNGVTSVTRDKERDRDMSRDVTLSVTERRLMARLEYLERAHEETRAIAAMTVGRLDAINERLVALAAAAGVHLSVEEAPPAVLSDPPVMIAPLVAAGDFELPADAPEPLLSHALVAGYQLMMFHHGLADLEDLAVPLTIEARVSLEEAHGSADRLVMPPDSAHAFALFMCWAELYARDQAVPRARKSPADFLLRIGQYVHAVVPAETARWTPRRVVAAWQRATGAPVSAPVEEMQ